jgi:ribosomal protein L11 methylase PrmA
MQDLAACSKKDGWMILSGILNELRFDIESAVERAGLKIVERCEAGEWSALAAKLAHTH